NLLKDAVNLTLTFLRAKSEQGGISYGLIRAWYCFGEVKQNWFGFCEGYNKGKGLGKDFARALDKNLVHVFRTFGDEKITKSNHLEKLCLIRSGVGRDMISDFTTNLIKDFLLTYTANFAEKFISSELLRCISVSRAIFDYKIERWMPKTYKLPFYLNDYVILTPKDILTKDDTWISHNDMFQKFQDIPDAVSNEQLRAEINRYFYNMIPKDKTPTKEERERAISSTFEKYPQLIDYYIKMKEDTGIEAFERSSSKVLKSNTLYIKQFGKLAQLLEENTSFYKIPDNTKNETKEKIVFFKDVIENKGGHKIFYDSDGLPIKREKDVHILFRLVWHGSPSVVSTEVNDGRGPVDFKISRKSNDITLVEFKLASNSQLKRNLEKQLEIYKTSSDANWGFKVIIYFSEDELIKTKKILKELEMDSDLYIFLVDARSDNKPSGSKA
ncbi:MAG: hypothetical protein ACD_79C01321G0001, partial [uncultured bacterium]